MVHIEMTAMVHGRSAAEVYPILCDFTAYAGYVDAVRSITSQQADGRSTSDWEVDFHGGIMRWKEEDVFLPDEHAFRFRQIEGDLEQFSGEWRVIDEGGGSRIDFRADFDLGVAGLSDALEPIAESALRENIRGIVSGLLGDVQFA